MSAKHTPGPWETSGMIVRDPEGREIADVHSQIIWQDHGEECANARLIAAAPELLEALTEAIMWDSYDEHDVPAVWLNKATAAIAKVKGES